MDNDAKLRNWVAYSLTALLILNTAATYVAVFLVGMGRLNLDKTVLLSLIGVTVAHVAVLLPMITRYLFPNLPQDRSTSR